MVHQVTEYLLHTNLFPAYHLEHSHHPRSYLPKNRK
ncbi:hypothetical protein EVA_18163 [gut metagenome]|uniref:Uncharacterized protein n=1 Tax=gut metagenome TaxID=749906 RepID=J9C1N0_9ZZZZ